MKSLLQKIFHIFKKNYFERLIKENFLQKFSCKKLVLEDFRIDEPEVTIKNYEGAGSSYEDAVSKSLNLTKVQNYTGSYSKIWQKVGIQKSSPSSP